MNETMKKLAIGSSALALAVAMGLQTFVFGHNDLQTIKENIAQLAERVAQLESAHVHE